MLSPSRHLYNKKASSHHCSGWMLFWGVAALFQTLLYLVLQLLGCQLAGNDTAIGIGHDDGRDGEEAELVDKGC